MSWFVIISDFVSHYFIFYPTWFHLFANRFWLQFGLLEKWVSSYLVISILTCQFQHLVFSLHYLRFFTSISIAFGLFLGTSIVVFFSSLDFRNCFGNLKFFFQFNFSFIVSLCILVQFIRIFLSIPKLIIFISILISMLCFHKNLSNVKFLEDSNHFSMEYKFLHIFIP
jgi:hypothetical protein